MGSRARALTFHLVILVAGFASAARGEVVRQDATPVPQPATPVTIAEQLRVNLLLHRARIQRDLSALDQQIRALAYLSPADDADRLSIHAPAPLIAEFLAVQASKRQALAVIEAYLTGALTVPEPVLTYRDLMVALQKIDDEKKRQWFENAKPRLLELQIDSAKPVREKGVQPSNVTMYEASFFIKSFRSPHLFQRLLSDQSLPLLEVSMSHSQTVSSENAALKTKFSYRNWPLPVDVDLRSHFPEIKSQGSTKACVAFSLTAALESLPDVPDDLSEKYMHGIFLVQQAPVSIPDLKTVVIPDQGCALASAINYLTQQGIPEEDEMPWDEQLGNPTSCSTQGDLFKITDTLNFSVGELRQNHRIMQQLLAAGHTPIIAVRSTRYFLEDWGYWVSGSTGSHAVLVVGYGREYNPLIEEQDDYFWIRDSSSAPINVDGTSHLIHYKVSAKELYAALDGNHPMVVILSAARSKSQ